MNETVLGRPIPVAAERRRPAVFGITRRSSAFYGYSALAVLIVLGWIVSDYDFINPEEGLGYWLGIAGGSMMLALLLYPLRKRSRIMNRLGATRHWFRMHMILGLVGPLLILYHSNYQLGSFNSKVAFYCMLAVALSGIVGRHFYATIHRGLYGRRTSLLELQADLAQAVDKGHAFARLMPRLVAKLDAHARELKGCEITQTLGVGRSLKWTVTRHFVRLSLWWTARQELRKAAARSANVRQSLDRIQRSTSRFIREYTTLVGRVAQFSFYERLFALWHVFHLPIFLMMVLSALIHVLAVHMY